MKNLKHVFGYLIIIGLTFFLTKTYFCGTSPSPPPHVSLDCVIAACKQDCEIPKVVIPLDEVGSLYNGFGSLADRFINQNEIDEKTIRELKRLLITRGVWFDYQEFKDYLSFIDKKAKDADVAISGIRFFPGRSSKDDDKFGQLTVFFNPTLKTKNSAGIEDNYAFALERNGNDVRPVLFEALPQLQGKANQSAKEVNEGAFFARTNSAAVFRAESLSGNGGQQSPPPHD